MSGQSCEDFMISLLTEISILHTKLAVYSSMSLPVPSSETTTAGVAVVAVEDVVTVAGTTYTYVRTNTL